jgi:hypothetical protein
MGGISVNVSACVTTTLPFSQVVTVSGSYPHTYTNAVGCDSIVTYAVIIKQPSAPSTVNVTACVTTTLPYGEVVTVSGSYPHTYTNAVGCDSIVTYAVIINQPSAPSTVNVSACVTTTLPFGQVVTVSGSYPHTYTNAVGCDSVVTYAVIIRQPSAPSTVNVTACVTTTLPYGQVVTVSGSYPHTYTNAVGCDSVVTYAVIIRQPSAPSTVNVTACVTTTLPFGQVVTVSGSYPHTYTNAVGCDSIVTYAVIIKQPSAPSTVNVTACVTTTLPFGQVVTVSGAYPHTYTNAVGCDSIVTYAVIINQPSAPSTV